MKKKKMIATISLFDIADKRDPLYIIIEKICEHYGLNGEIENILNELSNLSYAEGIILGLNH